MPVAAGQPAIGMHCINYHDLKSMKGRDDTPPIGSEVGALCNLYKYAVAAVFCTTACHGAASGHLPTDCRLGQVHTLCRQT
jgi:hypothetical protein